MTAEPARSQPAGSSPSTPAAGDAASPADGAATDGPAPPAGASAPAAPPAGSTTPDGSTPSGIARRAGAEPPTGPLTGNVISQQVHHADANPTGRRLGLLTLTALGVVFGDIGTSPLYAMLECFKPHYGLVPSAPNVYGMLSLILWSLLLVVSVKYVMYILRADNRGEGGVLALLALVLQRKHRGGEQRARAALIAIGLFGGAFLYGDGMITPAISVLGAVEGLKILAPSLEPWVVPLALVIIGLLFYFQYKGTGGVGKIFGPLMFVWFTTIGVLGVMEIMREPQILSAANPWYAVQFFLIHPLRAFVVLGAVVLVITGGEALYADMGHFGKKPIRLAWFGYVLPALVLNYFGQGGLLLRNPAAVENPFYLLAPRAFLLPLVILATLAAIVASQALISGAFSLTQQGVQLGYIPRVTIIHTSRKEAGQIYIPEVNKGLAVGTLLLVLMFRSASALGAAYGPAVTGTMAITTILFYVVARHHWEWPRWKAIGFLVVFLAIDLAFFAANLLKVPHGGWVPLLIAGAVFMLMITWKQGRTVLSDLLRRGTLPLDLFLTDVERKQPVRVTGTAVFLTSDPEGVPVVLLHHLKHNKVLHEQVILLSIMSAEVPEVSVVEKVTVEKLAVGFFRVRATYGFMEKPNVKEILARCNQLGLRTRPQETSYYLGRERLIPTGASRMMKWRKSIFIFMSRNARSATEFFGIPPNRAVELGTQIEF